MWTERPKKDMAVRHVSVGFDYPHVEVNYLYFSRRAIMPNTALELWQAALAVLERQLSKHQYETWLLPCRAQSVSGNTLYVVAATEIGRAHV